MAHSVDSMFGSDLYALSHHIHYICCGICYQRAEHCGPN